MRYSIVLFFICFFDLQPLGAVESISKKQHANLDSQLIKNSKRYGIVGQSVLLLKNGKPIYKGTQGFANLELAVPMADNHIYPVYSVAKLFTSVLMMQMVENGRVDLKQSIRTYLPYLPERWQDITVEHALNHTSGMPRYIDEAFEKNRFLPSKKDVFISLKDAPDHFEIGTRNLYNNTNFLILSAILEATSKQSYIDLVNENIITPLKAENTGHASAKSVVLNMVSSYQGGNGTVRKNSDIDWPSYTFSHSALYSTPEDLAAFMTALVAGKFVSKETLNNLWKPMKLTNGHMGYYAFGFEYAERDGYIQVGHDGGNRVKLRHYYKAEGSGDNYTLAYLTNGYSHSVWTDILADSVMATVDSTQFQLATTTEFFMTEILDNDAQSSEVLYKHISKALDNEDTSIEEFITNCSYAVRYAAGIEASLPAFKFLTKSFPNSANAWSNYAEQWQIIGNKKKAVEYYKIAVALNPEHKFAKQQLEQLIK